MKSDQLTRVKNVSTETNFSFGNIYTWNDCKNDSSLALLGFYIEIMKK